MSVGTELQTAIYGALGAGLTSAGAGLYDEAPELPVGMPADSFPYVIIGDADFDPFDTDDTLGYDAYFTLDIWSRYRGKSEAHDLFEVCRNLLHRQTLSLSSWTVYDILQFGGFSVNRESDNTTIHGFGRFVFKIQAS